ncbi:unnamed protein product [Oppiella nova]|uniref:RRM domain-containing protein n=1 Tax=Oppiella nova TaxID=334625 RepID=A0A7R9LFC2_9ACAR|nr:unnamed protein product [Oppiella nova]CAG2163092.1 unnamed protein product [Oppiella nova]
MSLNARKGKKGKGTKAKAIPLSMFVADDSSAPQGFNVVHTHKPKLDWAAEVDDQDLDDKFTLNYKRVDTSKVLLPSAPKSTRGPDIDMERVPADPPFKAYLGNLPYDVTEQEITRYFGKLSIIDVRLPQLNGRQRGFAYAEFETRESLIDALTKNGDMFRNRQLKVGLPGDNAENNTREGRPVREERQDRTAGDWRSGSGPTRPEEPRDSGRDNYRNGFDDRRSQREPSERTSFGRSSDGGERSFRPSNTRNDRDRHFEPYDNSNSYSNDGFSRSHDRDYERPNNRYGNRDNYGESNDRSYGRRYEDSGSRYSERSDDRRQFGRDFDRNRRDGPTRDYESRNNSSPPPSRDSHEESSSRPQERQKLQLKPRTKPITENNDNVTNSAIFGGAKPVNTAAREQEIEKKLLKEREESDKKLETSGEGRTRRISSSSNVSANSRSRKGSDSGPNSRDLDDSRGSGRRPRKTSERDRNSGSDSGPKYTLMTRGGRDGNDSSHAGSRFTPSRGDRGDRGSDSRGSYNRGNGGPNRNNNNNNRGKDRHTDGDSYDSYDKPPRMNQNNQRYEEEGDRKPQAIISSNKFAHLDTEDHDEDDVPNPSD